MSDLEIGWTGVPLSYQHGEILHAPRGLGRSWHCAIDDLSLGQVICDVSRGDFAQLLQLDAQFLAVLSPERTSRHDGVA